MSTDFYEFLHICVRNRKKKKIFSVLSVLNFFLSYVFENRNTGFVFCFLDLDIFVFVFFFSNRTQLFFFLKAFFSLCLGMEAGKMCLED